MARTKQTARLSTAFPRSRIGTSGSGDLQSTQVDIFKATGKRTIVVEGTSTFHVIPDLIFMSFLVEEIASTLAGGVQKAIAKIGEIRSILASCGVSNEDVSSDSIGTMVERTEYGNMKKDKNGQTFHRTALITEYKMQSVVRVCLEGERAAEQFGKVSLAVISSGIRSHGAPIYESTRITEQRNEARVDACANAKEKATKMLGALDGVRLGPPLSVTDIHCDLKDDADNSFLGNFEWHTPKRVIGPAPTKAEEEDDDNLDDETSFVNVPNKKARLEKSSDAKEDGSPDVNMASSVDESLAEQIFVVPPITIAARVQIIFEILS